MTANEPLPKCPVCGGRMKHHFRRYCGGEKTWYRYCENRHSMSYLTESEYRALCADVQRGREAREEDKCKTPRP